MEGRRVVDMVPTSDIYCEFCKHYIQAKYIIEKHGMKRDDLRHEIKPWPDEPDDGILNVIMIHNHVCLKTLNIDSTVIKNYEKPITKITGTVIECKTKNKNNDCPSFERRTDFKTQIQDKWNEGIEKGQRWTDNIIKGITGFFTN